MNVTILFFSTNRLEYLIPTLEAFHSKIHFENCNLNKIFIDDYPNGRNNDIFLEIKKHYNFDEMILHDENKGQSETWKEAWGIIPKNSDYIWHQEDDFTFPKDIKVNKFINILETMERALAQVSLKRQVWYENAYDFITEINNGNIGTEIEVQTKSGAKENLILHDRYFNANPCLYPRWVTEEKYSHNPQESVIINDLKNKYGDTIHSSIYGKRNDEPACTHIGYYNQGQKVSEGEPGWDWLKHYDNNKKYCSRGYLKIYEHKQ